MKVAILADIHGNLPALELVLDDAKKQGVEKFIIAGDYCLSGPEADECVSRIRSLEDTFIIRGNEEGYIENLVGKDQSKWTDGQMQISYWVYRNVSQDNRDYVINLPDTLDTEINGVPIHISHFSKALIGDKELEKWGSLVLALKYEKENLDEESLREEIRSSIAKEADFEEILSSLEEGVYIFGHSHVQWSYKSADRNVYLINPGSCGLPLDCILNSIPYTILDISDDGCVNVEQKRLPFDMGAYIDDLKKTSQYEEAHIWSKVIIKELETAKEHMGLFLPFVERYANSINDDVRPYSVKTWEKAYELWDEELRERG